MSKIKKEYGSWRTKQNTAKHSNFGNVTPQVKTDVRDIPVYEPTINPSSSREQYHGHQFHGMENIITNDESVARSDTEPTSDRTPPSVMLSFQLRGEVVELHLTRSNSQSSHCKVFVAKRGRITRWTPLSINDVS